MFNSIRPSILKRMRYLEEIDARDREDGTARMRRLRQVTPETGKFLALMASSAPSGSYLEIGTSAGYSTLWIGLACEMLGRHLTTFEVLPAKADLARETIRLAELESTVQLVEGDARDHFSQYDGISVCFLDAEKEVYAECYEAVVPRLLTGGWLIADNAISHRDELQPMLDRALGDQRVDALIVPIGKGELMCRKV